MSYTKVKKGVAFVATQITSIMFIDGPGAVQNAKGKLIATGDRIKLKGQTGNLRLSKDGYVLIPPSSKVISKEPTLTNLDKMPGDLSPAEASVILGLREMKQERFKMQRMAAEIAKQQAVTETETPPDTSDEEPDDEEPEASEETPEGE